MTEDARQYRNRTLIQQANPAFRVDLQAVLDDMATNGWRPRLQQVWRSLQDEAEAQRTHHSMVSFSFHNCSTPSGKPDALAADCLDDNAPLNPSRAYCFALARCAQNHGLHTGIAWSGEGVELTPAQKTGIQQEIDRGGDGSGYSGPLGFDPTHVETLSVTLLQAKAGMRPGFPPFDGVPV